MDLFERVVSVRGRLLKIEQYADPINNNAALVPGLLITFDVGRILVWGSEQASKLLLEQIVNADELPSRLVKLDEKEPWWRIIGSALTAAQSIDDESGYRLQFRENDRSPRTVSLTLEGDRIRIGLKNESIEPSKNG